MPDYKNGKIYKIECNITNDVYYGSTTKSLSDRMRRHKTTRHCNSVYIIDRGNYSCKIIENYPCNSKYELELRERWWIENNVCINQIIPTRTHKEWCEDNKERYLQWRKEYNQENKERVAQYNKKYQQEKKEKVTQKKKEKKKKKEYYENNKEQIAQKRKEYNQENKEQIKQYKKEYYENNKEQLAQKKKEYYQENKEQLAQKMKEKVTCECGAIVRKGDILRHCRTQKHLNLMSKNIIPTF